MLDFITNTCNIKRLITTTGIKKSYQVVLSNLDIDIQPGSGESLSNNGVNKTFNGYILTEDENLILFNDYIEVGTKKYIVESTKFWKGDSFLESYIELVLTENKVKE